MAGTNQAANLTGMLTSIGNTIGGMGAVGQQFVNPIVNMSRPDVDPNSLEDMQRLQQWQQTVGREDAARTTGMTMRDLEAKQKEERAKQDAARLQNAQSSISYLSNKMTEVMTDKSLSPEERSMKLAQLQTSADTIARQVPGLDPMAVGKLTENTEQSLFLKQEQQKQAQRAEESHVVRLEQAGFARKEAERANARFQEWSSNSENRKLLQQSQVKMAEQQQIAQQAKAVAGNEQAEKNFLLKYPDQKGTLQAVKDANEARELQLEELRAKASERSFVFTDTEMTDAGIPEELQTTIKKMSPQIANSVVTKFLTKKLTEKSAVVPPAALVSVFSDAAMEQAAKSLDMDLADADEEEMQAIESKASQLALIAADMYSKSGGDFQAAYSALLAGSPESKAEDPLAVMKQAIEEWKQSQQEGVPQ